MMNPSSSFVREGRRPQLRRTTSLGNVIFPSFRLVDAAATVSTTPAEGEPLRFTLHPSTWTTATKSLRPTLISPPVGSDDDDSTSSQSTADAPPFPSMESFARVDGSFKRPRAEVPPTSFLSYKRSDVVLAAASQFHHDSNASPMHKSNPPAIAAIRDLESTGMTNAASILVHMKNQETPVVQVKHNQELLMAVEPCILSAPKNNNNDDDDMTLVELASKPPPPAPVTTTTRSVTPVASSGLRLALPDDVHELNSLHCFVRAELLELFALPCDDSAGKNKFSGRVGLRCVHCAHLPRRARAGVTMSTFYPKSISDIYRSVCTWQRIHFRACRHVPPKVREMYWQLKDTDRTRGKTRYWVTSARSLGLVDVDSERGGICFQGTPSQSS